MLSDKIEAITPRFIKKELEECRVTNISNKLSEYSNIKLTVLSESLELRKIENRSTPSFIVLHLTPIVLHSTLIALYLIPIVRHLTLIVLQKRMKLPNLDYIR